MYVQVATAQKNCGRRADRHVEPAQSQRTKRRRRHKRQVVQRTAQHAAVRRHVGPHAVHVDAVNPIVLIPAPAESRKWGSKGMAGDAGDDVHLVAGRHPLAAVLVRPGCRRVDFRWEVVGEEEDAHDGFFSSGAA